MSETQERHQRKQWRGKRAEPSPEELFLHHLPRVERVAQSAGRRAGLPPQDVEDFVSTVKLKLLDDDYAVLRKHAGESSLATFLTAVVHNQFKDFCNHKWGKYRPSAAAKRLGPAARALERLLVIDRLDTEAAIDVLTRRQDLDASPEELREMAGELPERLGRHFVGEEALETRSADAPGTAADSRLHDGERHATAARVEEALNQALGALGPQDVVLLKMCYRDAMTVRAVSKALHLEPRPLYSRREKCLKTLREALREQGVTWEEVREVLGWKEAEIRADFGASDEKRPAGPSMSSEEGRT